MAIWWPAVKVTVSNRVRVNVNIRVSFGVRVGKEAKWNPRLSNPRIINLQSVVGYASLHGLSTEAKVRLNFRACAQSELLKCIV